MLKISSFKTTHVTKALQSIRSSPAMRLQIQRTAYQSHGCSLWKLLRDFSDSLCAVPHDKFYGLLGLASDCSQDELTVDYSKSLLELHRDVVSFYDTKFRRDYMKKIEVNSKMPKIVSFSNFLSRLLCARIPWVALFKNMSNEFSSLGSVGLLPSKNLIDVEAMMLGIITVLEDEENSYAVSHIFDTWDDEPGMSDDAYLGKVLVERETLPNDPPMKLNRSAQSGMALRDEETLYLQACKQIASTPSLGNITKSKARNTQGHAKLRKEGRSNVGVWFKATNELRGIECSGIRVGDLL